MPQIHDEAAYSSFTVGVREMALWIQALSEHEAVDKRNWHLATYFQMSSLTTLLKRHPYLSSLKTMQWKVCTLFFLSILFSHVLYLGDNTLGSPEVRMGNKTNEQKTERSRIQFLSLSLSANSFTFPIELARKNSSENYTKRCFSFW